MQLTCCRHHAFHGNDAPCVDGGSQGRSGSGPIPTCTTTFGKFSLVAGVSNRTLPKLPKPSAGLSLVACVPAPIRQGTSWNFWDLARS